MLWISAARCSVVNADERGSSFSGLRADRSMGNFSEDMAAQSSAFALAFGRWVHGFFRSIGRAGGRYRHGNDFTAGARAFAPACAAWPVARWWPPPEKNSAMGPLAH